MSGHKAGHDELQRPACGIHAAVSPLAPTNVPAMPPVAGVRLATAAAGIKYLNRPTCCWPCSRPAPPWPACSHKSKCPSAPVEWCRANLKRGKAARWWSNSGNANAFTGKTGRQAWPVHGEDRRPRHRLRAGRHLPGLDRRDRRAAQHQGLRRSHGGHGRRRAMRRRGWMRRRRS